MNLSHMCCCLEDLQASIIEMLLTTRRFIFKDDYVQVNQEKHAAMVYV